MEFNDLYNKIDQNRDSKSSLKDKFLEFKKTSLKFSSYDISLAGICLSIQIICMIIVKFTIARAFPIEVEFVFYIFYGLIFGPFKGSFLSFIADTLLLLIVGQIGAWYYLYALIPPLISFVASWYFFFFKLSKILSFFLFAIVVLAAAGVLIYVYINHANADGTFNLTRSKKNPRLISKEIIFYMLLVFISLIFISLITLWVAYAKTKNIKWANYALIFGVITFIIIIFRWTLGPLVWIRWWNHMYGAKKGLKTVGNEYVVTLVPIVIKTSITIPTYTIILAPLFTVISFLKEKNVQMNKNIMY